MCLPGIHPGSDGGVIGLGLPREPNPGFASTAGANISGPVETGHHPEARFRVARATLNRAVEWSEGDE
jgi:hypothetical protein